MSEFNCPKCTANVRTAPNEIGCPACGFGRGGQHNHEHSRADQNKSESKVEAPPGFKGDYLTEVR